MPAEEGTPPDPKPKRKRAPRAANPEPPAFATPIEKLPGAAHRLDAMTRARIDALEADKERLQAENRRLQARVDELAPEVAGLRVALDNAKANGLLSTVLTVIGGGVISYATFFGKVSQAAAAVGAALLICGVLISLASNLRRGP